MKPQKLIISAFGSYGSMEEIDFSKEQHGIFLITGDTGAGKTTIFDALTFALYGQTSGGERSGNMMRSQYAKAWAETHVELTFLYKEQQYKVRRNPEYQIEKILKNGTVKTQKVAQNVELTLPDGSIYPEKKAAVDKKIEEILGLSAEQFTQIVMIAQGDFLKLLYMKSDERKRIFSKLFQTDKYWKIQEQLKYRSMQLDGQMEENKRAYEQEQSRIMFPEELESEEHRSLEELNEKIKERKQTIEKECTQYQEKIKMLSITLSGIEEVNRQFGQFEKLLCQYQELKEKANEEELRRERIAQAVWAAKIRIYEEKYIEAKKQQEQSKKSIERLEVSVKQLEEKRERAGILAEEAQEAYYKLLLDQQAGILAMGLKEGHACPVCGSREHPALSVKGMTMQIKELEEALNKEKRKLIKSKEGLEQAQKELQMCKGQLKQETHKYAELESSSLATEKEYQKQLEKSVFTGEEAYKQAYLPERSRQKLERESSEYQKKRTLTEGQIVTWEKTLKGKEKQDTIELKQQLREMEDYAKKLERRKMTLHTAYQTNHTVLENSKNYKEKSMKLAKEDTIIKSLYRTASGKLSGSAKIDFETYIQRQYFKQIIREANKRLLTMSNQQFILKLKEENRIGKRSNEGLDLSVYSLVTDSERDVKTLSGGESFMAALAMALGLSDIVGRNAGGIRMDMMLIDEGFGSLDANSRRAAIEVLKKLSDGKRMVGIISHVTELKEQMEHKLVVTRSDKGSKVKWEIT